jgi:hypothetical protein
VRKVEYFTIRVPNKPAEAFTVLSALVTADVNLLACSGVPRGRRAEIDVVPDDTRKFKAVVRKAGLEFTPERTGFLIQGGDRTGALAQHLKKLGDRDINVTGIDSLSAGEGRWGAIIWVDANDARKAGRLLGATSRSAAVERASHSQRVNRKPERKH